MPTCRHTSNKLAYFVNADKTLLLNVNISTGTSQKVTCRHRFKKGCSLLINLLHLLQYFNRYMTEGDMPTCRHRFKKACSLLNAENRSVVTRNF